MRSFRLPGLEAGDPVFPVPLDAAQFVEIGRVSVADHAALREDDRRFGRDRRADERAHFVNRVEPLAALRKPRCPGAREALLQRRQRLERALQGRHVARVGPAGGDAGCQPLDVVDALEAPAHLAAQGRVLEKLLHAVLSGDDVVEGTQGTDEPVLEEAAAHRGKRSVEHPQQ